MYVSPSQVAGTLAMWAIRQSPYPVPDNLDSAIRKFEELFPCDDLGLHEVSSEEDLYRLVSAISEHVPEILAWNQRKNGNDALFGFVSRYDRPAPDNDFIDLSALWSNVARSVVNEERAASGIETEGHDGGTRHGAKHESPTPKGDAQNQPGDRSS